MSATKQSAAVESMVSGLVAELHAKSGCEKVGLAREALVAILCEVGGKYATPATSETELRAFFFTLRVDELALARACAAGSNPGWDIFLTRSGEKLFLSRRGWGAE